jgi:hypothetical protein
MFYEKFERTFKTYRKGIQTSKQMDNTCKAILAQGAKKGQRCWRPALDNNYCGKHSAVAKLEDEKAAGRIKWYE